MPKNKIVKLLNYSINDNNKETLLDLPDGSILLDDCNKDEDIGILFVDHSLRNYHTGWYLEHDWIYAVKNYLIERNMTPKVLIGKRDYAKLSLMNLYAIDFIDTYPELFEIVD